jgi:branched-chain amino acid transport system substrate-binding protein
MHTPTRCLAAFLLLTVATAWAQIKIGVTLSLTGPAASLDIPERDAIALLPREIGGQKIEYIELDDASDTTSAVKNAVTNGITKMTPEDHLWLDQRSRVMVQIVGGKWVLER